MTDTELRSKLLAAIVDHLRWWLAGDGVHMRRLHQNGKIDPKTLRKIANDYYVSRGLREGKESEIAEMLQERLVDWPGSLKERAEFVYELANDAKAVGGSDKAEQLTNGLQLSAFSKICWFLHPEGWTMYDKYAQWGLAHPKKSIGFIPFYEKLDTFDFVELANKMRGAVRTSKFPSLWPERIIDKYLMQCGQPETKDFSQVSEQADYLAVQNKFFGESFAGNVEALTDELLKLVKDEPLFAMHTQQTRPVLPT